MLSTRCTCTHTKSHQVYAELHSNSWKLCLVQRDEATVPSLSQEGRQDAGYTLHEANFSVTHTCTVNFVLSQNSWHVLLLCSLQELLLCPAWRIQEYVTLLQALQVHTHHNHPDHSHLSSVLEAMLRLRESVHKVELCFTKTITIESQSSLNVYFILHTNIFAVEEKLWERRTVGGNTASDQRVSCKTRTRAYKQTNTHTHTLFLT